MPLCDFPGSASVFVHARLSFLQPLRRRSTRRTNAGTLKLSTLIENMFGPRGLIVDSDVYVLDGTTHSAHFNSSFQSDISRLNIAIASQLSGLPLPSPASGFTCRFDENTGTFIRSTQSFGPILTERAETIGRGKTLFGYNVQGVFVRLAGRHQLGTRARGLQARRCPARWSTCRRCRHRQFVETQRQSVHGPGDVRNSRSARRVRRDSDRQHSPGP